VTRALTIVKAGSSGGADARETVPFAEVKTWVRPTRVWKHLFRYSDVRLRTQLLELLPKPFLSAVLIRALSRGRCVIEDEAGKSMSVDVGTIARLFRALLRDLVSRRSMLRAIEQRLAVNVRSIDRQALDVSGRPLYLRTDLVFGLTSGGSVGHIAGVLNNLDAFTGPPLFVTTDPIPTTRADIETWVVRPDGRYRDFNNLSSIAFNLLAADRIDRRLTPTAPAFVYQRYSISNFTGAELAARRRVPFVLEYNGSEVWIQRNWGQTPIGYLDLAERIESYNLDQADLIVVVSDVMREELEGRGVDPAKILVNPNGVDVDRYHPDVDGSAVRASLEWTNETVIGFIGTFGPWHGAEVLGEAFGTLLRDQPQMRSSVRLLMIGDGDRLAATQQLVERGGAQAETRFVGRTTQDEGIAHLAACDILVSPHVPNADGSRFFGSPTKLFEYMAMGRGIVASDLEQIGVVLEHGRTAWLVEPGNPDALAEGLCNLVERPDVRARLGAAARAQVVGQHTWREHTRRIIDGLAARRA
jgi:glycosyltransferase involved in cell wall biosynthesis